MLMKQIAVAVSVLVLGGYLAASDALAGGQRPSYTVKNGTLNLAGPQAKPPSNYFSGSPSSGSRINNGNNISLDGPFTGLKFIGR